MTALIHEVRTIVLVLVGGVLVIVGAKINDEVVRSLGVGIVVGALGMTQPGLVRDANMRTRASDHEPQERKSSGQ